VILGIVSYEYDENSPHVYSHQQYIESPKDQEIQRKPDLQNLMMSLIQFWCGDFAPINGTLEFSTSMYLCAQMVLNLGGFTIRGCNALLLPEFRPDHYEYRVVRLICVISLAGTVFLGPMICRWHCMKLIGRLLSVTATFAWVWLTHELNMQRDFHATYVPAWSMIGITLSVMAQDYVGAGVASSFLQKFVLVVLCMTYFNSGISKLRTDGLGWSPAVFMAQDRSDEAPLNSLAHQMLELDLDRVIGPATLVFEVCFPLLALGFRAFRPVFYFSALAFHVGIYLLIGPNFSSQALGFLLLIGTPELVKHVPVTPEEKPASSLAFLGEALLSIFGTCAMVMWVFALVDPTIARQWFLTSNMSLFGTSLCNSEDLVSVFHGLP
jgi:hypothetical protein